jgi:hypothetical protein
MRLEGDALLAIGGRRTSRGALRHSRHDDAGRRAVPSGYLAAFFFAAPGVFAVFAGFFAGAFEIFGAAALGVFTFRFVEFIFLFSFCRPRSPRRSRRVHIARRR